jgi:hypothetical protein
MPLGDNDLYYFGCYRKLIIKVIKENEIKGKALIRSGAEVINRDCELPIIHIWGD